MKQEFSKLNNKTKISTLPSVYETDTATIFNGQGSFATMLAASIYIGGAVFDKIQGEINL